MSSPCDLVEDFFDGELNAEEAERYRDHAATCEQCQRQLTVLSQLRALEVNYRRELEARVRTQDAVEAAAGRTFPLPWRWTAGGAVAALAAMLLVWLGWSRLYQVPESAWYPAGAQRLAEGRSAHSGARDHRPLAEGVLGASDAEVRSYDALGKLQRQGDLLGMASVHLSRNTARDAEDALEILGSAGESADVFSELAFAHLVRGNNDADHRDAQEALRLADQALALDPRHGPALWNRALALRALDLQFLAARAFDAAAESGERGWSDEARQNAQKLRASMEAAQGAWRAANRAGKELVRNGAQARPDERLLGAPVLRSFFYDAVRTRTSGQAVEALLPLARALDERAGDRTLQDYASAVAKRSWATWGPLAADYGRLAAGEPVDAAALLRRLREAGEADLLLGALDKLPQADRSADELKAIALAVEPDAWLASLAKRLEAKALGEAGNPRAAEEALEAALERCLRAGSRDRCGEEELALAYFLDHASEFERAGAHARQGWDAARRAQDWGLQLQLLLELAQLTRREENFSISRAYYEEALARDAGATPEIQRFANEGLANIDVLLLHAGDARRHIDAALATGQTLQLSGALALADIARLKPDDQRDAAAMEDFRKKRLPKLKDAKLALAEHALGRFEIERERQSGTALLRSSIQRATQGGLAGTDQTARQALAYSFTSLILDAGGHGEAEKALQLFEEERRLAGAGDPLPERCLLAVTADDERLLAVVRGAGGGPPKAAYETGRWAPLPWNLSGVLPPGVTGPLQGCPHVQVLARSPLYGRPGLLPPSLAWSYRGVVPGPRASAADGPRRHLVVQDVKLSPRRSPPLATPPTWDVRGLPGEVVQLGRDAATPSAVQRELAGDADLTDVTIIGHGQVLMETNEAYLLLAPEAEGGEDVLRASAVGKLTLRSHPLVVLAACQGARPAPVLHEARSLPAAFLRAGARAVLAASDKVPEREGPEFFGAVRRHIYAGAAPAEALRDVRDDWKAHGRWKPWLDGVLLFE